MTCFRCLYNDYKEEISKEKDLKDLEFKRIQLENELKNINNPILYLTISISIFSLIIAVWNRKSYSIESLVIMGIAIILVIIQAILFRINQLDSHENKIKKYKIEIIKLRIEELKQEKRIK